MTIPAAITKRQLAEVIKCYAMAFPDWELINGQVFVRTCGPIRQFVGIETLSWGAYRPWSGIQPLPLPDVGMLHQILDVKHQAVFLRDHPAKWRGVVAAMEEQFRPAIRKPLDLREVKTLCEQAAGATTNDLCMLAILHAYVGEKGKALTCCEWIQLLPPPTLAPRLDWEQRHREFGRQLRGAIEAGNERELLDASPTPP